MKKTETKASWISEIQGAILELKESKEKQDSLAKQMRILLTKQLVKDEVLEMADYCRSTSKKPPVWFLMGGLRPFVLGYNFTKKEVQLLDLEKDYYFDEFYEFGKVTVSKFWNSKSLNRAVVQILNKEHGKLKNKSLVASAEDFGGFGGIKLFKEDVLSESLAEFVKRSLLVRLPNLWAEDCKLQLKLQGGQADNKKLCTKTLTDAGLKKLIVDGLNSSYESWLDRYGHKKKTAKLFSSDEEFVRFESILSEALDDLESLPITEQNLVYKQILTAYDNNLLTSSEASEILKNRISNFGFKEFNYWMFANTRLSWFVFNLYTETLPRLLSPIAKEVKPLLDRWHAETGKELPYYLEQVFTSGPEIDRILFLK